MREKLETDFSLANSYSEQIRAGGITLPDLRELDTIYEAEIASEYVSLMGNIADVDSGRTRAKIICVFFDNSAPKDYFATYSAMKEVFKKFSVLDAYYEPQKYPGRAFLFRKPHETRIILRRPDGRGTFLWEFTPHPLMNNQVVAGKNRQILKYREGWDESWLREVF